MRRMPIFFLVIVVFLSSQFFITDTRAGEQVRLRTDARQLSEDDVKSMLVKYNMFDRTKNAKGAFANDLVDNGNGTVTDRITGLMWQKNGSAEGMMWSQTKNYINSLNRDRFAGHSDWRLPTIEELASLMKSARAKDLYIHPVFSNRQVYCWSIDTFGADTAWYVNFKGGMLRHSYHFYFHVRAVRSMN